jgi:hypothetical protein
MPSDKETLLSMGFEQNRVECTYPLSTRECFAPASEQTRATISLSLSRTGALKATSNRGLQPAMDHIFEHESDPVPDLSTASTSAGSAAGPAGEGDDDEDGEAALLGRSSAADLEAKVKQNIQCHI